MALGYLVTLGADNALWNGDSIDTTPTDFTPTGDENYIGAGSWTVTGTIDGQNVTDAQLSGLFYLGTNASGETQVYFVPDATDVVISSATVHAAPSFTANATDGTAGPDDITGTTDPNTINGLDGDDTLSGGAGGEADTDVLNGGAGDDSLSGGDGWDRLSGGAGNDTLDGGAGTDIADFNDGTAGINITLTGGNKVVDLTAAGLGVDSLSGIDGVIGTNFDDTLTGYDGDTAGADGSAQTNYIDGADGNDLISGLTGSDFLFGGEGNDTIIGGVSDGDAGVTLENGGTSEIGGADAGIDDRIFGGAGNDVLYGDGTAGNSTLGGNDLIDAGSGDDYVLAGAGQDTIYAGEGNDKIAAGEGDDSLSGGAGLDTLSGGNDQDTIHGDAGDDLIAGGGGADEIDGGLGNDTIYGGEGGGASFGDTPFYAIDGGGVLHQFVPAGSGGFTDTTIGNTGLVLGDIAISADGEMYGVDLNSGEIYTIDKSNAAVTSTGISTGFSESNSLSFDAAGNLYAGSGNSNTVERFDLASGNSTNWWTNTDGGNAAGDVIFFNGYAYASWISDAGQEQLYRLELDGDNNVLSQQLIGDLPDGTFGLSVGSAGNLYAAVQGQGGADFYAFEQPLEPGPIDFTLIEGNSVNGTNWQSATSSSEASQSTADADLGDTINGGDGNDEIYGQTGDDSLTGGEGNDTLDGGTDADYLSGDTGDDSLVGGTGDDTLLGGDGNDIGDGGTGADYLIGGDGLDTLLGGDDNDTIAGGFYDLTTGEHIDDDIADLVTGGMGNDTFFAEDNDTISDFNLGNTGQIDDLDQSNNDFVDLGTDFYNAANLAIWNANNPNQQYANPLQWMRADQADDGVLNDISTANGFTDALTLTIKSQGAPTVPSNLTYDNTNVLCFDAGVMIETDQGPVAAGDLKLGDLVMTTGAGLQPIRWIGRRDLDAIDLATFPNLRPIRIRQGALGKGLPTADLLVSPQHRVLVRSKIAMKMFGSDKVLVAAKQLCQIEGIDIATDRTSVTYVHFMFEDHQIVLSNGAETESLYTGPEALKAVGAAVHEEIFAIFPDLRDGAERTPAAAIASGRLGRKLAVRHAQNHKPLVS